MICSALGCRQRGDSSVVPVPQSNVLHCSLATPVCSPWILAGPLAAKLLGEELETPTTVTKNVVACSGMCFVWGLCKEEAYHVTVSLLEIQRQVLLGKLISDVGVALMGRWSPSLPGAEHGRGMLAPGYPAPPVILAGFLSLGFTLVG